MAPQLRGSCAHVIGMMATDCLSPHVSVCGYMMRCDERGDEVFEWSFEKYIYAYMVYIGKSYVAVRYGGCGL